MRIRLTALTLGQERDQSEEQSFSNSSGKRQCHTKGLPQGDGGPILTMLNTLTLTTANVAVAVSVLRVPWPCWLLHILVVSWLRERRGGESWRHNLEVALGLGDGDVVDGSEEEVRNGSQVLAIGWCHSQSLELGSP